MAQQSMTELRVGLFVFLGSVVALVTVFIIGSRQNTFERKYTLKAHFASVSGLRQGAAVQLAGVRVGTVDDITFSEKVSDRMVEVELRIDRSYQDRIRANSKATINTQGLLGDKFITISIGDESQAVLKHDDTIASEETSSFADLAEKAGNVMTELQKISKSINELFAEKGGNRGDVRAAVHSVRVLLEEIEKGDGLLHAFIYDPQGKELLSSITAAAKDTRDVIAGVKAGEGTVGRLLRDPSLYDDFRTLFGRVNRNKVLRTVIRATLRENEKQTLK